MSFNRLIGQEEMRGLLFRILNEEKISHALLLTGPAGSGKKSWGRLMAMAILCPERDGVDPCLDCSSCRSFQSGNHPGFFAVKPDGRNIKIDQFRSIREGFYLQGSKKVCLIENAEMMTAEASSSLLKILEEPPSGLHFILLSEQARLLFDTIVSRCQRYNLRPLNCGELTNLLVNEHNISNEKAELLARISGGLPGLAFDLLEDDKFEERYQEAKTLAYNLATGCDSAMQLLSWANYLSEKEDLVLFLELLCLFYRDKMVQNLCSTEPVAWLAHVSSDGLEEAVILINSIIYEMNNTNVNRRLLLEKSLILLQRRLSQCQKLSEFALNRRGKPTTFYQS